jgi:hypothetical protein
VGLDESGPCGNNTWGARVSICQQPPLSSSPQMAFSLTGEEIHLQFGLYMPLVRH